MLMARANSTLSPFLFVNASADGSTPALPLVLPGTTLIMGRFNHTAAFRQLIALDFSNTSSLLHLPPTVPLPASLSPAAAQNASALIFRKLVGGVGHDTEC